METKQSCPRAIFVQRRDAHERWQETKNFCKKFILKSLPSKTLTDISRYILQTCKLNQTFLIDRNLVFISSSFKKFIEQIKYTFCFLCKVFKTNLHRRFIFFINVMEWKKMKGNGREGNGSSPHSYIHWLEVNVQ